MTDIAAIWKSDKNGPYGCAKLKFTRISYRSVFYCLIFLSMVCWEHRTAAYLKSITQTARQSLPCGNPADGVIKMKPETGSGTGKLDNPRSHTALDASISSRALLSVVSVMFVPPRSLAIS